jgi:acyl carrier protein
MFSKGMAQQEDILLAIINTVLVNRGKKTVAKISGDTHLRSDLGFDSLDLAELTVRIEAKYDVDIFEDGIVNDVKEILQKIENSR